LPATSQAEKIHRLFQAIFRHQNTENKRTMIANCNSSPSPKSNNHALITTWRLESTSNFHRQSKSQGFSLNFEDISPTFSQTMFEFPDSSFFRKSGNLFKNRECKLTRKPKMKISLMHHIIDISYRVQLVILQRRWNHILHRTAAVAVYRAV